MGSLLEANSFRGPSTSFLPGKVGSLTASVVAAGTRGAPDWQAVKRYSGVQRKLDMGNGDGNKTDKSLKTTTQAKYRPPGKDIPNAVNKGRTARALSETADKLARMSVSARRQSMG